MRELSLVELLKAGVHFGHQVSRWHPKMRPFIFSSRGGVYIIDLEKTSEQLKRAQSFVHDVGAKGGIILYVGTKRQARSAMQTAAMSVGMPYVVERWLGGTFTNFPTIMKMTKRLAQLKQERAQGTHEKYTKKEQLTFNEEIERLERLIGGIEHLTRLPDAVFIVDLKEEKIAVREAMKVRVPIVALVDTNISPEGIAYPIPANDDATKSIQIMTAAVTEAFADGKKLSDARAAEQAAEKTESEKAAPNNPPALATGREVEAMSEKLQAVPKEESV